MELDNLKNIWQKIEPTDSNSSFINQEKIETMIKQQSKSIAQQIRNRFYLEIMMSIVVIFFIIIDTFLPFQVRIAVLGSGLLLMIPFTPVLIRFYKLIKTLDIAEGSLKESLKHNVHAFDEFLHYYIKINTVLGVLAIVATLSILRYYKNLGVIGTPFPDDVVRFIILAVISSIAMIPVTKWYINNMYGQYAKQLHKLLKDVEEE